MEQPTGREQLLNETTTNIEKNMLLLDPKASEENHRYYLAGVIDTLYDDCKISEEIRGELYETYCF